LVASQVLAERGAADHAGDDQADADANVESYLSAVRRTVPEHEVGYEFLCSLKARLRRERGLRAALAYDDWAPE